MSKYYIFIKHKGGENIQKQKIAKQNNYLLFAMVLIALVVIFSYDMGNVSAASGDSIYVNGTSGNNLYNGQSAVYDGTNGPKATIKNATGTVNSNGTIHIAQGTYYENNIKINTNMTIIGENQKNTIINGQQSGQSIFTIASGVYLTIINLTLTNATSNTDGAIYNDGNLNVYNSTFTNNKATYGGAISNGDNGALTINNSTFDNNTGLYGGVIWNSGSSSTITSNTFTNNTGTYGGVIYNEHSGTVNVINNTFNNNTATRGGAIFNYGISTETSNTFNNNTATNGGAIYHQGSSTLINNTFNNNTATNGGAIYFAGGILTVDNCNFTNNTGTYGGAIYNDHGTLTVDNSNFTNNTVTGYGGAIENYNGSLFVDNSNFTGNTASFSGGAIFKGGNAFTIDNSTFTNNTAGYEGGAIYNRGSAMTVDNSTFTSNNAKNEGGAIFNEGSAMTVDNSTFTSNNARDYGGAIANYGNAVVNYNRIVGNTANTGSAIICFSGNFDARYNWWGSNTDPSANLSGLISYDPWIILMVTANPATINVGGNSNITADLLHDSNGVYHDPVNGHVPDGITVNFSSDTKGTVNPIISTTTNGSTNTTFTGLQTGVSVVSAMVDYETVTTNVNINKISTAITVDTVSGLNGKTVNLTATLTDSDGNPVNGVNVQFSVNGTIIGSANTDTNGIATLPYTITQTSGIYTILANYIGNNTYAASSNTNKLQVTHTPTSTVMNALIGNKGETVNLTATLTDTVHQLAISGKTIKFLINGNLIGNAVTNSNGIATLSYTITQNGGSYYIDALFAGDNVYNSSTGGATLKVLQSNIYVTVTSSNIHPKIGETVKITFKVGNIGPDTANNVILTLKIPDGMEYVSATADTGLFTYNPTTRTITWNIGNVPVGDPKLILNIKVLKPGNYTIKPTITTTTYDPNILSNIGSKTINVSNNTTNPVQPVVNAETIPMQPTGAPIIPLIVGALMTLAGLVKTRKT